MLSCVHMALCPECGAVEWKCTRKGGQLSGLGVAEHCAKEAGLCTVRKGAGEGLSQDMA